MSVIAPKSVYFDRMQSLYCAIGMERVEGVGEMGEVRREDVLG